MIACNGLLLLLALVVGFWFGFATMSFLVANKLSGEEKDE